MTWKMIRIWLLAMLHFTLTSCGGGSGSGPVDGGIQGGTVPSALYVDPQNGVDADDRGRTADFPLATISRALAVIGTMPANVQTIILQPGLYKNEEFPIHISSKIRLVGAKFNIKSETIAMIDGCGPINTTGAKASVYIEGGTVMFVGARCITGTAFYISPTAKNVEIHNTIASQSETGFGIYGNGVQISSVAATNNTGNGIYVEAGAQATIIDSLVKANRIGVTVESMAKANFMNIAGTTGMSIIGNTDCNLRYFGADTLPMFGTIWDSSESNLSVVRDCINGANIASMGSGGVLIGISNLPTNPAFGAMKPLTPLSPINGEFIGLLTPTLQWTTDGSKLAAAAVFSSIPVIGADGISNLDDIVWYWHSGLGGGASGIVPFSSGRHPNKGNLTVLEPAVALEPGSTYYWIAWEWRETDGIISAASPIGFFRIHPAGK